MEDESKGDEQRFTFNNNTEFAGAEEKQRQIQAELGLLLSEKREILVETLGFCPYFEVKITGVVEVAPDFEGIRERDRAAGRDTFRLEELPEAQEQMAKLVALFNPKNVQPTHMYIGFDEVKDVLTSLNFVD